MNTQQDIRLPLLWKDYELVTPDSLLNRTPSSPRTKTAKQSLFKRAIGQQKERNFTFPITVELQPMRGQVNKEAKKKFKANKKKSKLPENPMKIDSIIELKRQAGKGVQQWQKEENQRYLLSQDQAQQDYFAIDLKSLQAFFDLSKVPAVQQEMDQQQISLSDARQRYIEQLYTRLDKLKEIGGINGLSNLLRTNIREGINQKNKFDISQRMAAFGENTQKPFHVRSVFELFIGVCKQDKVFLAIIVLLTVNIFLVSFQEGQQWDSLKYVITIVFATVAGYCRAVITHNYSLQIIAHQTLIKDKNKALQKMITVIRNKQNKQIEQKELLVGDILIFRQGDMIQVDGILTKQTDFDVIKLSSPFVNTVDQLREKRVHDFSESSGEIRDPFIFAGSQIIQGEGEMIVLTVGESTSSYLSFLSSLIDKNIVKGDQQKKNKTRNMMHDPFSLKVQRATVERGQMSLLLVMFIVLILILRLNLQRVEAIRWFKQLPALENPSLIVWLTTYLDYVMYAVLLVIMMVPTNIVQILNFYMINVIRLVRERQVMVEDYSTLFWLGQVNELVVDKTGCLTRSEMKVAAIYIRREQHFLKKDGWVMKIGSKEIKSIEVFLNIISKFCHESPQFSEKFLRPDASRLLLENICINSKGTLMSDVQKGVNFASSQGSRNELALLNFAKYNGLDYEQYRINGMIKRIFPFKSDVKRMITLYQVKDCQLRIYIKGTPDLIVPNCSRIYYTDTKIESIFEVDDIEYQTRIFGDENCMKLVAFAYKDLEPFNSDAEMKEFIEKAKPHHEELFTQLTFIALVGIEDPIRPESKSSVQSLIQAQINVRLFTGDNEETAVSSARVCGILTPKDVLDKAVIKGDTFQQLFDPRGNQLRSFKFKSSRPLNPHQTEAQKSLLTYQYHGVQDKQSLLAILSSLKVLAKASAKDKEVLLASLKMFNRIICLTGDDAENSRAVEQAHIGVGLAGSETKSSIRIANVVLLNDSIEGIKEVVAQGRGVFLALSKLIKAQTCSSYTLFLFCVCSALLRSNPIVLPLPTLMLLIVFLNFASLYVLLNSNKNIIQLVMRQKPYTQYDSILTTNQQNHLRAMLVLITLECFIAVTLDLFEQLHSACAGLILLIHVQTLSFQVESWRIKVKGALLGLSLVYIQWQTATLTDGVNHTLFLSFEAYAICLAVAEVNFRFVKMIT